MFNNIDILFILQEQKWEERRKHLTKFLRDITEDFRLE